MRSHSSCLFHTGQSLLVDFGLRLVFFTLVSRCWWTLACALPLVLSFSHWSVAVGGLWLVRFHSSCLFFTLVSRCWWTLAYALPLVLSFVFDIGQSLLMEFGLCAPTSLVFLIVVSYCWWTLTCALPLVLSF